MKNLFNLFAAFILLTGAVFAQNTPVKFAQNDLVALLPKSDAVATINLKRVFNEAMPQVLASKPNELAALNAKLDKIKAQTGIDLRQFEQAAFGLNLKQVRAGVFEAEPVALLRGNYNAGGLLGIIKIATDGKYRQETISGKTVTIFSIPETAKTAAKQTGKKGDFLGKMIDMSLRGEIAMVSVDANTLALGKLPQVRALLAPSATKTRVGSDISEYINRKPNAIVNFAGNFPTGLSPFVKIGNTQIDSTLETLRQISGSMDMNGGSASLLLAIQTAELAQAKDVEDMLSAGRDLVKGFLSMKSSDKNEILLRTVESVKITRNQSEVQLQSDLSQADLNVLLGIL